MDCKETSKGSPQDRMENTIARVLRIGVLVAAIIAAVGGIMYLWLNGSEQVPDFARFSYESLPTETRRYTSVRAVADSFFSFSAEGWIMFGVLVLILTPIMRVVLALVGFVRERDWIFAGITSFVLAVIVMNSIGG